MLPNGITIDAEGSSRVFEVESGVTASFSSFTITGGRTADGVNGSDGTNGNLLVSGGPGSPGEASAPGGGISNAGTLELNGVTLYNCATGNGGNGGNGGSGLLQGAGGSGGASGHGGGIYNEGTLIVLNSTIVNNETGTGGNPGTGGIFPLGGPSGSGGGIYNGGTLTLDHATITGNMTGSPHPDTFAPTLGGGVFDASQLTLRNTVIAQNSAQNSPDLSGRVEDRAGINFVGDPGDATGLGTVDNDYLTGDPQLGDLQDHGGPTMTCAPLDGSPLVDAGSPTLHIDQRGASRPFGGSVDIGAVETFIARIKFNAGGNNDGTSWANAYPDLQSALTADPWPSQIWGAQGIYYPDITGDTDSDLREATFQLKNEVALYGGFPNTGTPTFTDRDFITHTTILSGDIDQNDGDDFANSDGNAYHVLTGSDTNATAILDGFTISSGNADDPNLPFAAGGGLYSERGSPTLTNCSFTGNYGDFGGGVYNSFASPSLTNCTFSDNHAVLGGGIYSQNGSSCRVTNCLFSGNRASAGGGLYNLLSSLTLTSCTFSGNRADGGGGVYNDGRPVTLSHCVIWNNRDQSGTGTSRASAFNTTLLSSNYSYCLIQGQNPTGIGNLDGTDPANDPLFVLPVNPNAAPTTGGDFRLQEGSPALDAGDDSKNNTTTDLAGNPRKVGIIDLGAYEGAVSPTEFLPLLWETDLDGDGSSYGVELALGTDPNVWNRQPLGDFTPDSNGDPAFSFSREPNPAGNYILKVMRSPDLTPGSFTEIFRITPNSGGNATEAGNSFFVIGNAVTLIDFDSPAGASYYRLEAEYVAPRL